MKFVGRESELKTLNERYDSDKFEFLVIYGRRRVGKTALIREFIRDKKAVFFSGIETSVQQNLDNFSREIMAAFVNEGFDASFTSFQAALEYLFRRSETGRMILVMDEYPYIAHSDRSLASVLQRLIDKYEKKSKMMLILCGSSMSYMEDEVLAYKSPLYGRRTGQMKIQPFRFPDACRMLTGFSEENKALVYGAAGGTPQYLQQMDDRKSFSWNIKNTFLNPNSFLYEEPVNLLKQEVREPGIYTAIITAIASGAAKPTEIAAKAGIGNRPAAVYLKSLCELEIIHKEFPYGETNSRKVIYSVSDNMFRFWYRFVPSNTSLIERGAFEAAWNRIEKQIPDYMGHVFEEICTQYLWDLMLAGRSPVQFSNLSRWWGTDPELKQQAEIDIMGEGDSNTALFAECKWRNEKTDTDVLTKLVHNSQLFHYQQVYLYLFSKSGYTDACRNKAEQIGDRVKLVSFEELFRG